MGDTRRLTRRGFIGIAGAGVAGVLLAACAAPAATPTTAPAPTAKPAAAATTAPAVATTAPAAATAKPTVAAVAPTAKPAASSAAEGEVKFMARGDAPIFKVFGDLRDAFQKDYPKIKVTIDESPGDWYQKFQLQIASGTPPDALFESAGTTTASARVGALEPLDDLMKGDSRFKRDAYWDICFLPSMLAGKTYHLPYDGGSMALFYNKDMFKASGLPNLDPKTPITLDELLTIAQKLTTDQAGKRSGETGFDPKRIKTYGYAGRTQWAFIFANGGEYFTEDGTKSALNQPAAIEAIQKLAEMGSKHYVMPSPEFELASPVTFATGTVGIQYDGVWSAVRYRANAFDWDIAPFPKGKSKFSTGWYSGLSVTAASKLKPAAWEWIYYCCSEPGQKIVSGLGQAVPVIKAMATTTAFLDPSTKPASKQTFLDEMDAKVLRLPGDKQKSPFMGYWREHGQVLDPLLDPVWRGKATAADQLKTAETKINHLLTTGQVT